MAFPFFLHFPDRQGCHFRRASCCWCGTKKHIQNICLAPGIIAFPEASRCTCQMQVAWESCLAGLGNFWLGIIRFGSTRKLLFQNKCLHSEIGDFSQPYPSTLQALRVLQQHVSGDGHIGLPEACFQNVLECNCRIGRNTHTHIHISVIREMQQEAPFLF